MEKNLEDDWYPIRMLDNRVQQGEPLVLTPEVRGLLQRTAPTVAINEAETEAALASPEKATALLQEMRRRITEGSRRLSRALNQMYRLRDGRDLEGARQQLRELLAVEVVPHYRNIAEGQLEKLGD
ncbi:DUSAM domain-containing protein [Stigmatella erecta]|uniref:DUSAM domain-containing protein n=1 Tax=Stigmatella erecta TaxID=83460 RepID=A0A1H9ZQT2_9BACT|nr:DUSAM domain-containing protein [Stigmatella erecta]SES83714.1 DUSAM domain-containing protein [Stigmatella erecta]